VANGHAGSPWETRTATSAEGAVREKRGVAAQDEGFDSRWCIANLPFDVRRPDGDGMTAVAACRCHIPIGFTNLLRPGGMAVKHSRRYARSRIRSKETRIKKPHRSGALLARSLRRDTVAQALDQNL
jgi:hypothetical protein